MLEVQKFLFSNSLSDLEKKYGVKGRVDLNLNVVCLNYNQINSPMEEQIVQECRCLILELDSWKVMSRSYDKFFNHTEPLSKGFDWTNFKTYEKEDGSLLVFWFHPIHGWQTSTRSVPGGDTPIGDSPLTFNQLVRQTLKDMGTSFEKVTEVLDSNYCYIFELCCKENMVVVNHLENRIVLTGVRSLREPYFKECELETWASWNPAFPLPLVTLYDGFSKEAVMMTVQTRNPLEHEGFVLVDINFNRIKLKSDSYCLLSHQRDGLGKSNKVRLELILSEKVDDVLSILPQFVQDKILIIQTALISLVDNINKTYREIKDIETQKDFAFEALKHRYSGVLFALRSGRVESAMDWFKNASPKSTLEWLTLEDREEISE